MSLHPVNLALRFLLEIAALLALGAWGWQTGEGWLRFALALGIPLVAAVLWGTFRVPDDSSSAPVAAPVAVPGVLRLAFELVLFAFAPWALYDAGYVTLAWILGLAAAIHYVTSYDRILWLMRQ
jgi:hypothetical protein